MLLDRELVDELLSCRALEILTKPLSHRRVAYYIGLLFSRLDKHIDRAVDTLRA